VTPILWAVIHETDIGRGPEYGVAGGPYPQWASAENQLAYCHGMQADQRHGSEGRYFIAEICEVSDAD
jgi:hypothetical protein